MAGGAGVGGAVARLPARSADGGGPGLAAPRVAACFKGQEARERREPGSSGRKRDGPKPGSLHSVRMVKGTGAGPPAAGGQGGGGSRGDRVEVSQGRGRGIEQVSVAIVVDAFLAQRPIPRGYPRGPRTRGGGQGCSRSSRGPGPGRCGRGATARGRSRPISGRARGRRRRLRRAASGGMRGCGVGQVEAGAEVLQPRFANGGEQRVVVYSRTVTASDNRSRGVVHTPSLRGLRPGRRGASSASRR